MLRRVTRVRADVSEEPDASFIRQVPQKRRFLQEPHCVTFQKTPFFIVSAVKTSNLTNSLCLPLSSQTSPTHQAKTWEPHEDNWPVGLLQYLNDSTNNPSCGRGRGTSGSTRTAGHCWLYLSRMLTCNMQTLGNPLIGSGLIDIKR
jgi:hypothetical protein